MVNLQLETTTILKQLAKKEFLSNEKTKYFPIEKEAELEQLENTINEDNIDEYVDAIKKLGVKSYEDSLKKILSPAVITEYNYDGIHGKKAFKTFENLNTVLFRASQHGADKENYTKELRRGFKRIKACIRKNKCVANKKMKIN